MTLFRRVVEPLGGWAWLLKVNSEEEALEGCSPVPFDV